MKTESLRSQIARRPFLSPCLGLHPVAKSMLDTLRKDTWTPSGRHISVRPPLVWESDNPTEREIFFQLNAFRPVIAGLDVLLRQGVPQGPLIDVERIMLDFVIDWCRGGQYDPATFTPTFLKMRWNDMAAGYRTGALVYFVQRLAPLPEKEDTWKLLLQQIEGHYLYLKEEKYWAKYSNHGFYQSMGLYNIGACLPELPQAHEACRIAQQRIEYFLDHSFSEDGIWLEHSPTYHHSMLRLLRLFASFANFPRPLHAKLIRLANLGEEALKWMVQPDKTLAPWGDSADAILDMQLAQSALSGAQGSHTSLPAGMAFYRSTKSPQHSCYFSQMAAFHSRAHKHLDALSFIWWARGMQITADAGRASFSVVPMRDKNLIREGFFYEDPMRIYAESERAHCTIEIDERPESRASQRIYGSGLEQSGHDACGAFWTLGRVPRRGGLIHRRTTLVHAQGWLLVDDDITPPQGHCQSHIFDQWFLFGAGLRAADPEPPMNSSCLILQGQQGNIHICSLTQAIPQLFYGQREPFLAGWLCPAPETTIPTYSLRLRHQGISAHFLTLFSLDPITSAQYDTDNGNKIYVSWRTPQKDWKISLSVEGLPV